ncbi:glutamine-hydrolyzing carbamoyl-phosphate synthase small subunit [Deltaproteobacteria bacterium TL4]
MKEGILVLSNGTCYRGRLRGALGQASGEVIFNTAMSGYQEILTDPSYTGQIVTMTYPQMGNYGLNAEDMESSQVHAAALIVKELSLVTSNWRSSQSLEDGMLKSGVPILEGIDTRSLVKILRAQGECSGLIFPVDEDTNIEELKTQASKLPSMVGQNLAKNVSTKEQYVWETENSKTNLHVVAYDFGIKRNILKIMSRLGLKITVVPYHTSPEKVLEMNPDGIFLSNGPGDPSAVGEGISNVKALLGKRPIFGICLGHQILGLALGCQTYKLKCGHHGGNHPVMDYATNKIEITSHNHGFAVDEKTLPKNVRVTHRNLNDQTVEGIEATDYPAYSVQYHPEAAPGPRDAEYLFDRFVELMKSKA